MDWIDFVPGMVAAGVLWLLWHAAIKPSWRQAFGPIRHSFDVLFNDADGALRGHVRLQAANEREAMELALRGFGKRFSTFSSVTVRVPRAVWDED